MNAIVETANAAAEAAAHGATLTVPLHQYPPTFWAICSGVVIQIGWIVRSSIKGQPERTKAQTERMIAEADADQATLNTLLAQISTLSTRITDLERQVVDERRSCDDRMREMDKRHDREVSELKGELKGMRDNFLQQGKSMADVIALGGKVPAAMRVALDKLGDQG